ncbi:hypothetical protein N7510_011780 [Penicillium lagena]|uniref:uncharacterized protein n=1 Tax=Penicillium lagena TaxID=94218 RepID=UPI00253F6D6D|nr:uncharacterized protein N7510_011780 [Penicillium lagena]KAJ5602246.1 hypothetical protein N7510_011780 [Penicillium lagena]
MHLLHAICRRLLDQKLAVASLLFAFITAIVSLRFLIIPNLQRLNLRVGASFYDYGFYGLYPSRRYVTFDYESPAVNFVQWDSQCSDAYTFIAPHGGVVEYSAPMILDSRGNLVWMKPLFDTPEDFRVQEYLGEKYLTYWHGGYSSGHGQGSWSLLDSSYSHRFEVKPVGNLDGDLHDFQITENGTALVTIYDVKPHDLTESGGAKHGYIYDSIFQEIDIATGSLNFEWRCSQHIPLNASYAGLKGRGWKREDPYDAYHINSIDKDPSGNYLISARHLHAILSIDGKTGEILWILGGKQNEFEDASEGRATNFAWQHDARWRSDDTITLLDNTAEWFFDPPTESRGLAIVIDIPNRVARVQGEYFHPGSIRTTSQGNMQDLPGSRNVFVGWGHCAAYTEFSPDGRVLCDAHFGPSTWFTLGNVVSYRSTKSSWVGKPNTNPAAVLIRSSVFVSWNGATEVVAWRIEQWDGVDMDDMHFEPLKVVKKEGFETKIDLPQGVAHVYFRIVALNGQNEILGMTGVMGEQLDWNFRDFVRSYSVGVFSSGVVISFVMIGCCLLQGVFWTWRVHRSRPLSRPGGYRAVPLGSVPE